MIREITLSGILCNAFDKDNSVDQAAINLGALKTELVTIKRRFGPDSPRLTELVRMIPIQENIALGKLQGDQIFTQLEQSGINLKKHD